MEMFTALDAIAYAILNGMENIQVGLARGPSTRHLDWHFWKWAGKNLLTKLRTIAKLNYDQTPVFRL